MSSFIQHPPARENFSAQRPSHSDSSTRLSPDQRDQWTAMVNLSQHPMLVLDDGFHPIVLNDVLRRRLSDPTLAAGTDQPVTFLWQRVCDAVCRLVSEAAGSGVTDFAEFFPVHQRGFAAIGSVLRREGRVVGAIVNIGEATSVSPTEGAPESADREDQESFHDWTGKREKARQKIARLSRRESQVVSLVSDGLPNKSIAKVLDISVKTIEKHRANATRKLGVGSTAEMVRISVVADAKGPDAEPPTLEPIAPPLFPLGN